MEIYFRARTPGERATDRRPAGPGGTSPVDIAPIGAYHFFVNNAKQPPQADRPPAGMRNRRASWLATFSGLFLREEPARPGAPSGAAKGEAGPGIAGDARLARLQQLLGNRYRFDRLLGRGGSAIVFLVTHLDLQRPEALKVLSSQYDNEPDFARRFIQEAKVAAALDHPHIVRIFEFGQEEGIYWYTMKYIAGPSLAAVMSRRQGMNPSWVARLAIPVLDALDYSHRRGIIHRDIKPGNILLDEHNTPYLADFGIAKSTESLRTTMAGHFMGTPAYVSPEQASGRKMDGRSDLYSMGVVLYEMLSGSNPFPAEDPLQSVVQRLTEAPRPLVERRPDLDPGLADIVMRCLALDPAQRFTSAASVRESLSRFLDRRMADPAATVISPIVLPPGLSAPDAEASVPTLIKPVAKAPAAGPDAERPVPPLIQPAATATAAGPVRRRVRPWVPVAAALAVVAATVLFLQPWRSRLMPAGPPAAETAALSPKQVQSSVPAEGPSSRPLSAPARSAEGDNRPPAPTEEPRSRPAAPDRSGPKTPTAPAPSPSPAAGVPVRPPVLLEAAEAHLPAGSAPGCAGQIVNLALRIGTDGMVRDARVISKGQSADCAAAAQAAARQYRYQPAVDASGQPVEATVWVAIELLEGGK